MEENRELAFARSLEEVRSLAKEQQNCISRQQVEEVFKEHSLSKEQFGLIYDYLKQHKIGVGEPVDLDEYLSKEETDYLEEYKKSIYQKEPASEGEREAVILSAMAGEKEARERLICLFLPQVVEISRLYAGQGVLLEDLIGEGNVALSMGVSLLGCAEHAKDAEGMLARMVMDAMEALIAQSRQEADKDRKILDRVNQVAGKARELAGELHRKVTVEELSQETGMSQKTIREAFRMSGFAIEDLER